MPLRLVVLISGSGILLQALLPSFAGMHGVRDALVERRLLIDSINHLNPRG